MVGEHQKKLKRSVVIRIEFKRMEQCGGSAEDRDER